jgi:hypothetical protein
MSEVVIRYQLVNVRFQYFTHVRSHLTQTATVIIALIHMKHLAAMRLSRTCADTNRARLCYLVPLYFRSSHGTMKNRHDLQDFSRFSRFLIILKILNNPVDPVYFLRSRSCRGRRPETTENGG